jgi:DNA-binding GntR family transcriptional regulator
VFPPHVADTARLPGAEPLLGVAMMPSRAKAAATRGLGLTAWRGRIIQTVVASPPRFQRSVDEHLAIVQALRARDGGVAAEAMRRHLASARAHLVYLT